MDCYGLLTSCRDLNWPWVDDSFPLARIKSVDYCLTHCVDLWGRPLDGSLLWWFPYLCDDCFGVLEGKELLGVKSKLRLTHIWLNCAAGFVIMNDWVFMREPLLSRRIRWVCLHVSYRVIVRPWYSSVILHFWFIFLLTDIGVLYATMAASLSFCDSLVEHEFLFELEGRNCIVWWHCWLPDDCWLLSSC